MRCQSDRAGIRDANLCRRFAAKPWTRAGNQEHSGTRIRRFRSPLAPLSLLGLVHAAGPRADNPGYQHPSDAQSRAEGFG
jgi:hypothetical protein